MPITRQLTEEAFASLPPAVERECGDIREDRLIDLGAVICTEACRIAVNWNKVM